MNKENYVAVKTSVGLTERKMMPNIVMQGGKWGPLKSSNSMDKIGKECKIKGKILIQMRESKKFAPCLLGISECGKNSLELNRMINPKIWAKKLRYHTPNENGKSKCHIIHVGKSKESLDLKVHGFPADTYLGDIISALENTTLNRAANSLGTWEPGSHEMYNLKQILW